MVRKRDKRLKDCPFCDWVAEIVVCDAENIAFTAYVQCARCRCRTENFTELYRNFEFFSPSDKANVKLKAINTWNRRAE